MSTPTDHEVINAMRIYGGSFITHLSRLYDCADTTNQSRIRDAFHDYWAEYTELATMLKKKANAAAK